MSTLTHHMTHSTSSVVPKTTKSEHKKADYVTIIGRIAAVLSVVMYVSYIAQIGNNLAGNPGTPWQPLAATFNCIFWAAYGILKPQKDWPIIVANVPGVFLALATVITTFIH